MHFDPDARVLVLSQWHKIQLCDNFSSVIFICLTPFSYFLYMFGLIGYMILMKEDVSLTNVAMKMGKIDCYSDHTKNALFGNFMSDHPRNVAFKTYILETQTTTERVTLI